MTDKTYDGIAIGGPLAGRYLVSPYWQYKAVIRPLMRVDMVHSWDDVADHETKEVIYAHQTWTRADDGKTFGLWFVVEGSAQFDISELIQELVENYRPLTPS